MRRWIGHMQEFDTRHPRRYASFDGAVKRMRDENPHLTAEMAHHLTLHGMRENEDGTAAGSSITTCGCTRRTSSTSRKRARSEPDPLPRPAHPRLRELGRRSEEDGKASAFHNYKTVLVKDAGHWVHHDQLDVFMRVLRDFL